MFRMRVPVALYLLSLLLIGVGYIAITPPFEGFDEPAHFSSLRQIADTGTIPLYGKSFLPQDVANYGGPVAYSTLQPPFDRGLTYAKFFADPALIARFVEEYRRPHPHPPFVPSATPDYESQHPPLYYLALAPVSRLIEPAAFVTQIFVLRLVSYLLALVGVFFAWRAATSSGSIADRRAAVNGFLLYPIMLPMFFPEFARIGNDSLCLMLAGLAAYFLARQLADERGIAWAAALGTSLGLGLLTKAFFLPITFAVTVFLLLRAWRGTVDGHWRRLQLRNAVIALAIALFVGGGWYVYDALANGVLIGGDDAVSGTLGALSRYFSLFSVLRGFVVIVITWIWAGTWSLARLSLPLYLPLLLLLAIVIGAFVGRLRRSSLEDPAWLPVVLFAVFGCGLLYHIIVVVAHGGDGGTAGWYLHILMPWTAPALGLGLEPLLRQGWSRAIVAALAVYAALFQAMAVWAQIALFTGCAVKGDDKYYVFSGHLYCIDQYATIFSRLSIIGWPWLASAGFGGGLLCAAWLTFHTRHGRVRHEGVP